MTQAAAEDTMLDLFLHSFVSPVFHSICFHFVVVIVVVDIDQHCWCCLWSCSLFFSSVTCSLV